MSEAAAVTKTGWETRDRNTACALFVIALLLYLPGIWWGLPYATAANRVRPWGSDELAPLGPIAELYSVFVAPTPTFNPQYPLFHYMVQALFVAPYMAVLKVTGGLTQASVTYPFGLTDPVSSLATMTLLARVASLLMAAGTVVVAYRTASILWDRRSGLLASVLVMLMYPMFYYSRTSNVDMGALFWTSLGLCVFAASLRYGFTVGRAAWLGLFAALATASKDASYVVFVVAGLALLPQHLKLHRAAGSAMRSAWRAPLTALVVGGVAYAVTSGLVFHPGRFALHLEFISHGSPQSRGITFGSTPNTIGGYLGLLGRTFGHAIDAWGIPMSLLIASGMVLSWKRRRCLLFALPALGIPFAVILPAGFVMLRYVLIPAYVLALFGGFAGAEWLRTRSMGRRRLAALVLTAVCAWSLLRGGDLTYQMLRDSRHEAAAWFRKHAAPGDRVGYFGAILKLPRFDPGVEIVPAPWQTFYRTPPHGPPPDFLVVIPQQTYEPVHDWTIPENVYRAMLDGSLGYRPVLMIQTRSLFSKRPVTFVNPPVRVFVRRDRALSPD